MLCPESFEGEQNENIEQDKKAFKKNKNRKIPAEGTGSLELSSYISPKTWKKSISKFFRNPLRTTRSSEGDKPSGSNKRFVEKDITPEQKWQSLGKMFRRQNLDSWKAPNQDNYQKKNLTMKKALSSYFGKNLKSPSIHDD